VAVVHVRQPATRVLTHTPLGEQLSVVHTLESLHTEGRELAEHETQPETGTLTHTRSRHKSDVHELLSLHGERLELVHDTANAGVAKTHKSKNNKDNLRIILGWYRAEAGGLDAR